jgi:hypothetical protein
MCKPAIDTGVSTIHASAMRSGGDMSNLDPVENVGDQLQIPLRFPPKRIRLRPSQLKPAKAILDLKIEPYPLRLAELEKVGDALFSIPIKINRRHEIIDGHARWMLAKRFQREYIECEIFDYNEEETLREILKKFLSGPAGLNCSDFTLTENIFFPKSILVPAWRDAVLDYLKAAIREGRKVQSAHVYDVRHYLDSQNDAYWNGDVDYYPKSMVFAKYISRYLRRLPISERRILPSDRKRVRFIVYDKILKKIVPDCLRIEF